MKKANPNNRFEVLLEEQLGPDSFMRSSDRTLIIRDKLTGVLYLFAYYCNGGGLTPLLGRDGKPIVDLNQYTPQF
ncbi:MAG: DUF6440 family protein [Oscillospiraceae bacterium]|nr:DUF6440 family protein [Oscillospiraceae bacterium]